MPSSSYDGGKLHYYPLVLEGVEQQRIFYLEPTARARSPSLLPLIEIRGGQRPAGWGSAAGGRAQLVADDGRGLLRQGKASDG